MSLLWAVYIMEVLSLAEPLCANLSFKLITVLVYIYYLGLFANFESKFVMIFLFSEPSVRTLAWASSLGVWPREGTTSVA